MMEKKHSEKQDDSYYDALIKQRIGEALRNQSKKERLDLAQLEAWVEADRQRRRAKVKRVLAIASCFIIICAGTFSFKFAFDDDAIATAGKNDNKVNEEGNNAVVKPNEEGTDENTGGEEIIVREWTGVNEVKEQYEDLVVPSRIPSGYNFDSLTINGNTAIKKYTYLFSNGDKTLIIDQMTDTELAVVYDYDRKIQCEQHELLIDDRNGKIGYFALDDGYVSIISDVSDNELVEIVNGIK